jgi:U3 small nucleolar ribonucleoprotein protein LCP5
VHFKRFIYSHTPCAKAGDKRHRRAPPPAALVDDLAALTANGTDPYVESTSGLGVGGSASAGSRSASNKQARKLEEMRQYEEENMTRLFMSKKDAKRRRQDEEDVALGGAGLTRSRRGRAYGGFEGELADVLGAIEGGRRPPKRAAGRDGDDDVYGVMRGFKHKARQLQAGAEHDSTAPSSSSRQKKGKFEREMHRASKKARKNKAT